jgi:hypothetical protein
MPCYALPRTCIWLPLIAAVSSRSSRRIWKKIEHGALSQNQNQWQIGSKQERVDRECARGARGRWRGGSRRSAASSRAASARAAPPPPPSSPPQRRSGGRSTGGVRGMPASRGGAEWRRWQLRRPGTGPELGGCGKARRPPAEEEGEEGRKRLRPRRGEATCFAAHTSVTARPRYWFLSDNAKHGCPHSQKGPRAVISVARPFVTPPLTLETGPTQLARSSPGSHRR